MEILKLEELCKTYGKGETKVEALKNVSFSVEKGEFVSVVGESGSGKSTLLNCVGGLDNPTSGKVILDNYDLFGMKEKQRRSMKFICFIFGLEKLFFYARHSICEEGVDLIMKKVSLRIEDEILDQLVWTIFSLFSVLFSKYHTRCMHQTYCLDKDCLAAVSLSRNFGYFG